MYLRLFVICLLSFVKIIQCSKEGFLFRHYSGLCISVKNGTNNLYLSKHCTDRFKWTKYHSIMHVQSGMCIIPKDNKDDAKIFLKDDCKNPSGVFRFTANMSLQHIKSSKCLHPYWGCPVPSQGEDLVLHSACDEERLRFDSMKENTNCRPLYPYCYGVDLKQVSSNSSSVQCIQGLEWHWVYMIAVFGSGILLAQWAVIVCIYSKMIKADKKDKENYPHFGSSAKKKLSVSYDESEDVKMLGITSTADDTGWRFSEYSDTSIEEDEKETAQPIDDVDKEDNDIQEKRAYINIDYNKNKKSKTKTSQNGSKEEQSRRTSKLSFDFSSKMRNVFKVRKSYTLNDLEMLKRISIERHEYEEPVSPLSLDASKKAKKSNANNDNNTSEYVEPDGKSPRIRSASVPAKMAPPEYYLKPVLSEKERGHGKFRKARAVYVNAEPVSPSRADRNLYDMPELSQIKEQDTAYSQCDSHVYVKILED